MSMKLYEMTEEEREDLLVDTTHYNIHYNVRDKYKHIFTKLVSDTQLTKHHKETWCFITNSARAIKYRAKGLSIPKNDRVYYKNVQGISYRKMFAVLDKLVETGYLLYYKGGFISREERIQSAYVFTDQWLSLWQGVDVADEQDTLEVVQIRDRVTGEFKSTRGVTGIGDIRKTMLDFNNVLVNTEISLDGVGLSVQQYKRLFSDNIQTGGRMYNTVGGVQTKSQEDRKQLTINGEAVCELDFKCLHGALLYEQLWQELPEKTDEWVDLVWKGEFLPYSADVSFLYVDYERLQHHKNLIQNQQYNPVRNLVKFAFMCCINAEEGEGRDPLRPAYAALAKEYYEDLKRPQRSQKYFGVICPLDKNGDSVLPAKKIIKAVQESNLPIAHHFLTDVGIKLQYTDSEIMAHVVSALLSEDEVLLPEHDSIIVRQSIEQRATELMKLAYKDIVGSDRFCFVEKK